MVAHSRSAGRSSVLMIREGMRDLVLLVEENGIGNTSWLILSGVIVLMIQKQTGSPPRRRGLTTYLLTLVTQPKAVKRSDSSILGLF